MRQHEDKELYPQTMRSGKAATKLVVQCPSVQWMWPRLIVAGVALGTGVTGRKEKVAFRLNYYHVC